MKNTDDKTRDLFAEAVGLTNGFLIPYSISKLMSLMSEFAKKWGVEWNVGDGEEKTYSVWVAHRQTDMYVEVEDNALSDAIILAVTVAYLNMKSRPAGKVISLHEWKLQNRS